MRNIGIIFAGLSEQSAGVSFSAGPVLYMGSINKSLI